MPLELYKRRHSTECLAEIERRVAAGEIQMPDLEQYRTCRCAWWVRGTNDHGQKIPRQSLKVYTWAAACAELRKLNQSTGEMVAAPPVSELKEQGRTSLESAQRAWLEDVELSGAQPPTMHGYDLVGRKLIEYMQGQKLLHVQDVTALHLNDMRAMWSGLSVNTHNTYRTNLSNFLNFCVRMEWIASNPMKKTRSVIKRALTEADLAIGGEESEDDPNATLPLDEEGDANYQKICAAIVPFLRNELDRPGQQRKRARQSVFLQHPENFLSQCHLMYETGLRVSDATFFNPEKMQVDAHGGIYTTRQIKTRRPVTVFLDPWLVEEIQALPRLHGPYPFFDGDKDWRRFINNNIRLVLRQIGKAIGMESSLRPHRFRDSFAVNELNDGTTMDELRLKLGHANVAMTERYYAPFVKSRAASLRDRHLATRKARRSGKLVSISQGIA